MDLSKQDLLWAGLSTGGCITGAMQCVDVYILFGPGGLFLQVLGVQ